MKQHSLKANHRRDAIIGWAFITPQMAGFVFFVLLPLISVFLYSVQEKNLLFGTSVFNGLENFRLLFADPLFSKSLVNTLIFSAGVVPLNLIFSLLLALYLGGGKMGTRFVRGIIFLPVVTSGVAWAIVWKYLLQGGDAGPINWFLSLVGIEGPNWLFEKGWAMASVIINRVMKNLGMNVLIFMGAVLNMPGDVIEAARIDGAKRFTLFFKIKLPLLMPTVMMVAIVTIIGSMRVFDTIKLMTDGGPEGSTMVMVYYIYHQAFRMFDTGFASALAVVLFLIVLVLTALQWFSRKRISFYES
ncbi:MAG: ABC-type transporter, integral rane subunit [Spirochaeta sp.]|jgi:multiple sugar transport system permease protein|uniref:carbohydrate ABC transporter permease n=1 Tax=Sphaerochaeta TaxID=399320 RepID=UPI0013695E92|nr:sugar ABC transporter permease [Sphaerochaeta halotolerans]MBG0767717.1 sugar ABC transporter permease [Spirochaetaceae bacterium]MBZ4673286.1 ABC-type transporter, integral rane subunit [Spirochaeta sp.]MXI87702.1 ABC transporter permease subunit [Sphaerochaeta halotolerans]